MRAYFAMIWDETDPAASMTAADLHARIMACASKPVRKIRTRGFSIYDLSADRTRNGLIAIAAKGSLQGVVFGTLFERMSSIAGQSPVTRVMTGKAQRLYDTAGQSIVEDFWGNYVAFIRGQRSFSIISDPTSSIPCFYTRQGGVTCVFSHLEKCSFLDRSRFSINYRFLSQLLVYDRIQTGETGLNDVSELIGGQRLTIRPDRASVDTIWDPRAVAMDRYEPAVARAADELREMTKAVVQSHAALYPTITMQLSGGLDSSIVLACLARTGAGYDLNALHSTAGTGDVPEDRYAQMAADRAACEMMRIALPSGHAVPDTGDHPLSARPLREVLSPSLFSSSGDSARRIGRGVFSGQGGDHLFLHSRSPLGVVDQVRAHGLSRALWPELLHSSRLLGKSVWRVMHDVWPYLFGKRPTSPLVREIRRRAKNLGQALPLRQDIESGLSTLPIWVREPAGLPPAKFDQINGLLHMIQVREMLDRSGTRDFVNPLVSQPLIELVLRLPCHLLCLNGQSRGLARLAFSGEIPDEIRHRMTKGSVTEHFIAGLDANRRKIYDGLNDGELMRHGLIDRASIESFLRCPTGQLHLHGKSVLRYYCIEAWLGSWRYALASGSAGTVSLHGVG